MKKLFYILSIFNFIFFIGHNSIANKRTEILLKEGFSKVTSDVFYNKKIKVHRLLEIFNCKVSDIRNTAGQARGENIREIIKKDFHIILNLPKGAHLKNKDIDDNMLCSAEVILEQEPKEEKKTKPTKTK